MGNKVEFQIIKEVRTAKYYALSVDSTPDISHTDQSYDKHGWNIYSKLE